MGICGDALARASARMDLDPVYHFLHSYSDKQILVTRRLSAAQLILGLVSVATHLAVFVTLCIHDDQDLDGDVVEKPQWEATHPDKFGTGIWIGIVFIIAGILGLVSSTRAVGADRDDIYSSTVRKKWLLAHFLLNLLSMVLSTVLLATSAHSFRTYMNMTSIAKEQCYKWVALAMTLVGSVALVLFNISCCWNIGWCRIRRNKIPPEDLVDFSESKIDSTPPSSQT